MSKNAVGQIPNSPPFVDTLGWLYFKKGMLDDAVGVLCRALQLEITSEVHQAHLLKALEKMPRLTPDQRELRDQLRIDSDPERDARVLELAIKLAK